MSKYLPIEKFVYVTRLRPDEVLDRLESVTEPRKNLRIGVFSLFSADRHREYEGEIRENAFRISRIIYYRNSFLPTIQGSVSEDDGRTLIRVKMQLNDFVKVFVIIWMSLVSIAVIGMTLAVLTSRTFHPTLLIPYGMWVFGYLLTVVAFKLEALKSKRFFATLLQAEIEEN